MYNQGNQSDPHQQQLPDLQMAQGTVQGNQQYYIQGLQYQNQGQQQFVQQPVYQNGASQQLPTLQSQQQYIQPQYAVQDSNLPVQMQQMPEGGQAVLAGQQYVAQQQIQEGIMGQQQIIQPAQGITSQVVSQQTQLPGPQTLPGMSTLPSSSTQAGILPGISGSIGNGGGSNYQSIPSKPAEAHPPRPPQAQSNNKPPQRVAQSNLQKEITSLIFDHIMEGDIAKLTQHQQRLKGFEKPEDLGRLIDSTCYHQNALFVSCVIKNEQKAYEMTKYLIDNCRCDPRMTDDLNQTCLFYAARDGREQLARLFLTHGCAAHHVDSFGQTPIFYAAREGHVGVIRMLVEAGADADHMDEDQQTPIFYAVIHGWSDCVEYLMGNCQIDLHREDLKGLNLIQYAHKNKKMNLVEKLIEKNVYCPPEIKRKLALQGKGSTRNMRGPGGAEGGPIDMQLEKNLTEDLQRAKILEELCVKNIEETFNSSQVKEIQKQTAENKQVRLYTLTFDKEDMNQEVNAQEFEAFKQQCPLVAQLLANPALLSEVPEPNIPEKNTPLHDSWDKMAKRLIASLWRTSQAQIFHNPVDPDRLGIHDYFDVVKDPMDFGTIKQRLAHNRYESMDQVVRDIERCFENCLAYNGEDSPAGQSCLKVKSEYLKLKLQLNIEFYLNTFPPTLTSFAAMTAGAPNYNYQ